jgi:hypothetical protein
MSEYWDRQTEGFNQGANNLGRAMIMIPRMRAMQNYRNQELQIRAAQEQSAAQERAAREGLIGAQTGESNAKTQEILKRLSLAEALGAKAAPAIRAFQAGNMSDPAIDDYLNTASEMTGANKGDVVKAFKGSLGTVLAAGGNTKLAGAVENPVSVANNEADNAQKAARPVVVGSGATLMKPDGSPLAEGGVTLNPGQNRFAPQNLADAFSGVQLNPQAQPEAQGQPMPSKSSATDAERSRFVAQVLNNDKLDTPEKKRTAIETYDAQVGGGLGQALTQGAPTPQAQLVAKPAAQVDLSQIPKAHIQWLAAHQTPENMASFDATYGKGAANSVLP